MTPKQVFSTVYKEVIHLLSEKLPCTLYYHCKEHTIYVVEKAEHIANMEGVTGQDLYLIKIAALFHDIGFIEQREDHEQVGCKIMRKKLAGLLSEDQLDTIAGMIMATKIPQTPTNTMERIVADADLEYLATNKFNDVGDKLYKELQYYDKTMNLIKWDQLQVSFIEKHHYHTRYCKHYKEHRKQQNLAILKKSIAKSS